MKKINQNLSQTTILGVRLKSLIAKKNITQNQLAQKIGVSGAIISDYINGKSYPSFERAVEISNILNVSIDFLAGKSELESSNDCERAFAEKYNLDQETLEGFIDSLNDIKQFSDSLDCKEIENFIDEFLKSDLIQDLLLSTFIICLKKDALITARKSEELLKIDIDEQINDLDKHYITFCEKLLNDTILCPYKLIDRFAENHSLCFSSDKLRKLNEATSITNLGDILRNLNFFTGKNYFIKFLGYISAYVKGTLPQIIGKQAKFIVEEHIKQTFYKNGEVNDKT